MTYLRFGIRDLLWAMVVVGLALALMQQRALWWYMALERNHEHTERILAESQYEASRLQLEELVRLIEESQRT